MQSRSVPGGYIEWLDAMGDELTIVNSARASFGKRKDLFEKSDEGLLKYLWTHRHTSPFEKCTMLFYVECSLPVRAQWFRHRTWSYNEVSRRYTSEGLEWIIPTPFRKQDDVNKQSSTKELPKKLSEWAVEAFEESYQKAFDAYTSLLSWGMCREQARYVLPQGIKTSFYAKVDLKNLMDFLVLRMAPDAQYEIRVFADAIREMLKQRFPLCMGLLEQGKWVWVEDEG